MKWEERKHAFWFHKPFTETDIDNNLMWSEIFTAPQLSFPIWPFNPRGKKSQRRKTEERAIIWFSMNTSGLLRILAWHGLTGLFFTVHICVRTYVCVWDWFCVIKRPDQHVEPGETRATWNHLNVKNDMVPTLLFSPDHTHKHIISLQSLALGLFSPPPPLPPFFSPLLPLSSPPPSVPGHLVRGSLLCGTAADYVIISGPFWSPAVCVWN